MGSGGVRAVLVLTLALGADAVGRAEDGVPAPEALLIVDAQVAFFRDGSPLEVRRAPATLAALARLVRWHREHGRSVLYTRQVTDPAAGSGVWFDPEFLREGSDGARIAPEVAPRADEQVVTKNASSGFDGTDLARILHREGIATITIAGVTTDVCVAATAADALRLGFGVKVVADATSARDDRTHADALRRLVAIGAEVTALARAAPDLSDAAPRPHP